jgi:catechol 2,3-dioxygenase-like lactoylglutathione lyase family enzyme
MQLKLISVMVDDQSRAASFYTEKLGFRLKHDIPLGEFRWLTVVSPEASDEVELVLEPNANPAAKTFQKAMFDQGIPLLALESSDVAKDHARLTALGVAFIKPPTAAGPTVIALFSDTCGNLVQIYQPPDPARS